MGIPLRVLLIEDSAQDAELLLNQLAAGGYEPEWRIVQTAADLAAALNRQEWDIVISDFCMPQFEGMKALRMVKEKCESLPFILVSGTIGEETAVIAMRAGANDYLMKDRLSRLPMVVKREIQEARHRSTVEQTLLAAAVERKRAEVEMRESVQRYRSLVLATSQAIWSTNAGGEIINDQPSWRALTGQTLDQLLGRGWLDAIHPDDHGRVTRWWTDSVRLGAPCECEFKLNASDGTTRDIVARGVPVRDDDSSLREWVGTCTDVTERKAAQAALAKHQLQLEQSNGRLEELYQTAQCFVDNVSHEFRTPLTVIKGYAEVIEQGFAGPISEQQREFISFILERSRDLAQMVDDLLDSSKLRVGTLRVNRRPHQVEQIMERVRPMIAAKAATNKVEVVEEIAGGLPEIFADAEKVGRIILNFAVNAIKFSPEGSAIRLWVRPSTNGMLEIGITDHGPGITPEDLRQLFNRFRQVGDAQNGTVKGFGLGLNIARELVALNFGDINVASTFGEGSTFSFRVPINDPAAIVRRYMVHLGNDPAAGEMICLFRITMGASGELTDSVRGLLASIVRPRELLLDGPDPDSLLLIGCTNDAARWLENLRKAAGSSLRHPIEIQQISSWQHPKEHPAMEEEVLEMLRLEPAHA